MTTSEILNQIAAQLLKKDETLSVAESVTAGLITNYFSHVDNATSFFQGGITVYNLGQKTRHLGVDPIYAEKVNCVSEVIAEQMAIKVAESFCSTWAIGITGYAAPVPELDITNCFAYFSISYRSTAIATSRIDAENATLPEVQQFFAKSVLESLNEIMKSPPAR